MIKKYLDEMLKMTTVAEVEKGETQYVSGCYIDKKPVLGLYLKAKKDSILAKIESMAKGKFTLENDSENYAQEVRFYFFRKLDEYLNNYGEPNTKEEIDTMEKWLYKACRDYMTDISRSLKSNTLIYDRKTGEYDVFQILSLDRNENEDLLEMIQGEASKKLEEKSKKTFNDFRIWFDKNKGKILTKKQREYLQDGTVVKDESNEYKMRNRISERVYSIYTEDMINSYKVKLIERKLNILTDILESKSNRFSIDKVVDYIISDEDWLIEVIYSLSFDTCKMITELCEGNNEYVVSEKNIKEVRVELYKLYNFLSSILENTSN